MSKKSTGKKSKRLTVSAGASPARLSQSRGGEKETPMKDGYGPNLKGAFAVFNPNGSLSRTSEGCYIQTLDGNLQTFSEGFPASGTMRNGVLYPRPPWVRPIEENESSSWPTPCAQEDQKSPEAHMAMKRRMKGGPRNTITSLTVLVKAWPTPRANESTGKCVHGQGGLDLQTEVAFWATPTTEDAKGRGYTYDKGNHDKPRPSLTGQVWATPTSRDHKDGANPSENVKTNSLLGRQAPRSMNGGTPSSISTPNSPRQWMTPKASDGVFASPRTSDRPKEMSTHLQTQSQTVTGHLRLNPSFVEWLMGFPIGWTVLEPSETQSFRKSRKS